MFPLCLSVCWLVCEQNFTKATQQIPKKAWMEDISRHRVDVVNFCDRFSHLF